MGMGGTRGRRRLGRGGASSWSISFGLKRPASLSTSFQERTSPLPSMFPLETISNLAAILEGLRPQTPAGDPWKTVSSILPFSLLPLSSFSLKRPESADSIPFSSLRLLSRLWTSSLSP